MTGIPAAEFDRRIEGWPDEAVWAEYYAPTSAPRRWRQRRLLEALGARAGERVLDVGCGAGGFAFQAAEQGAVVVGVDHSHASLVAAARIGRRLGPAAPRYVRAEVTTLPIGAARFDKVLCVDVYDVIPAERHRVLIAECLRALRPGGRLILYTPNSRREAIGRAIRPLRRWLGAWRRRDCPFHIGLTTPGRVRRLLRELEVEGRVAYADMNYPWLAALPVVRAWVAGHMLWTVVRPEHP